MPKIIGEFTTILPVAIAAGIDILNKSPNPIKLSISGSDVLISLGEQTAAVFDDQGDVSELPRIKSLKVWITCHASTEFDSNGEEKLASGEDSKYEQLLIEAVRRTVSVSKSKTGQWNIDTRHPIYSYDYAYHREDQTIRTTFPLASGSYKMPEYALGPIMLPIFHGDLRSDIWDAIPSEAESSVTIPLYNELIHDALTLRSEMSYQLAALTAAIAIELMLEKICFVLMQSQGELPANKIQAILSGQGMSSLISRIEKLAPNLTLGISDIQQVARIRNEIVHGESRYTDYDQTNHIIKTAHEARL